MKNTHNQYIYQGIQKEWTRKGDERKMRKNEKKSPNLNCKIVVYFI